MKARTVILSLALAAITLGAQDTVRFSRSFKEGDKDTYNMHIVATTQMGDVDLDMSMNQLVKHVSENGEADLETSFPVMHGQMNGNELPLHAPPTSIIHVDKRGIPTKMGAGGGMDQMQFSRYGGLFYDRDLKVGQEIPVDYTDPANAKNRTSGTLKLASVQAGEAQMVAVLKVWSAKSQTPMDVKMTTWVDIASSKPNRMDGEVTNMSMETPGPPVTAVKLSMQRVH